MLRFREIYEIWRRNNSLRQAWNDAHSMLERADRMFQQSRKSLRESDPGEIGIEIYEEDRMLNHYQQEVRRKVLRYLAITGGINVVPGLVLTSIVIDIERIGDYTKNIVELAVVHPDKLTGGRYEQDLKKIESSVGDIFNQIVSILRTMNKEAARTLIRDNLWIRKRCDEINLDLIRGKEALLSLGDAVALALYVRYLKRVAAHLLNILSSVVNPVERIGYREKEET
jgi:phosphate uptake regulator